jgi:hypothetical protein
MRRQQVRYGGQRQVDPREQRSVGFVESVTQDLGSSSHKVFKPYNVSPRFAQTGNDETDLDVRNMASGAESASEGERLFMEPDAARSVDVVV